MCTWFKHDSDARHDRKLNLLRTHHGYRGTGIYWAVLEAMAYDDDHYLPNDSKVIATLLGISSRAEREALRAVLYDYDLFEVDEESNEIYSPRLSYTLGMIGKASSSEQADGNTAGERKPQRKYTVSDKKLKQLEQAREKRALNSESNSESNSETNSERNSENSENSEINSETNSEARSEINSEINSENGGNIRGENKKEIKNRELDIERGGKTQTRFTPPSLDDVKSYCTEKGYAWNPEAFYDYYTSVGWVIGKGKKMKDWKASVRNWNSREDSTYQNWQASRQRNNNKSNERNYTGSGVNDEAYKQAGWV